MKLLKASKLACSKLELEVFIQDREMYLRVGNTVLDFDTAEILVKRLNQLIPYNNYSVPKKISIESIGIPHNV